MGTRDIGLCWACPKGKKKKARERHHILPVEWGGPKEGRLVNLCPTCHTELHDLARAVIQQEPIKENYSERVILLARYAVEQYNRFKATGEKKAKGARHMAQVSFTRDELAIAHDVKKSLGFRSLERTIKFLIIDKWKQLKQNNRAS